MDCDAYRLLITGYVDGELSDQEMHSLKTHLETCEECLAYLKCTEAMRTSLKRYTFLKTVPPEIPINFAWNITEQLQGMREEEQLSLAARIRIAYHAFVLDIVERWVSSLRTRPFAWTTLVTGLLLVVAGVIALNMFPFSSTPDPQIAMAPHTKPLSANENPDQFVVVAPESESGFAEEPFIRMAQTDTESVEDYIYSHVTEVYQDRFVDDAVFVEYVQNAFME